MTFNVTVVITSAEIYDGAFPFSKHWLSGNKLRAPVPTFWSALWHALCFWGSVSCEICIPLDSPHVTTIPHWIIWLTQMLLLSSAVKNVGIFLGYFLQSWILIQLLQIWLQFNNSRPEWSNSPEISSAGRMNLPPRDHFLSGSLRQLQFLLLCPGKKYTTTFPLHLVVRSNRGKKKQSESSTIFSYFCSMVLLFIRLS